jgi:pimeloyl-ACP methyl ester carboxylesterase
MNTLLRAAALGAAMAMLAACSGDDNDDEDDQGVLPVDQTYVVFNPAFSQLPIPNDLLFAGEAAADGTMCANGDNRDETACEPSDNPVIEGLNTLDGASLLSPFDVMFTASLNPNTPLDARNFVVAGSSVIPNPDQNIFLLPLRFPSGDSLLQAEADVTGDGQPESVEVPTFAEAITYQGAVATSDVATLMSLASPAARAELISLDGGVDNVIRITPLEPLMPKTKYLIVITGPISDSAGNPVLPSPSYTGIRDPDSNLAGVNPGLIPLRPAIQSWESLAMGYFGFQDSVFAAAGVSGSAPSYDDILMTLTFTTTAAEDTLMAVAAPETFFEASLRDGYKKAAIEKLVLGTYNISGDNSGLTSATDIAINSTIAFLLASPTLPDTSPNPLYNASIAGAIGQGASYASVSQDASAAFIMQSAAAQAAITVHDNPDAADGFTLAQEAMGAVMAVAAVDDLFTNVFPVPAPRAARFFRVDPASAINPALAAPALVYQGQITLPVYQAPPGDSGLEVVTSKWEASTYIGSRIDTVQGNDAGSTPRSEMVTYRYPFPEKQGETTVPLLAVMPDETTLAAFGIARPENGWPVIIFQHGITTDRSGILPMADALAFACVAPDLSGPSGAPCFASVAIDQPLHGVVPGGSIVPGLSSVTDPDVAIVANLPVGDPVGPSNNITERHYDFSANASLQPIPMDYAADFGDSGSLFINLLNFANTRDTLRQLSVDLLNVNATLEVLDVNGDGLANELDTDRVYFIGHSLGGINGAPFVAVNNSDAVQNSPFSSQPYVRAMTLMKSGGGVARLLTNSRSRAAQILMGLAGASDELVQGRSGLESYLNVFQGVVDPADPMSYAHMLADANSETGVLLTSVIGDGTDAHPSDHVIPNAADERWGTGPLIMDVNGFMINGFGAPLAGTEPLVAEFGAVKSADASSDGDAAVLVTRFTEGSHGTPIVAGNQEVDPFTSGAVFMEMIREITTFFALNGDVDGSLVVDPSVVED